MTTKTFTLPETGLIPEKQVLSHIAPVARSTLWVWRRRGDFPNPVAMSSGRVGYRAEDLRAWLASRQEVSHAEY